MFSVSTVGPGAHPFGSWSGSRSRRLSRHYSHSLNARHGSPIVLYGLCCLRIFLAAEYIRLKATRRRHSDIRLKKRESLLADFLEQVERNGMTRVFGPLIHRISSCGFVSRSLTQTRTLAESCCMGDGARYALGVANHNDCNNVHSSSQLSKFQRLRSRKAVA